MNSQSTVDFYQILELQKNCSDEDIKKAYRREALRWHPDKHQGETKANAEIQFKLLSEAYEVLKDPEARKLYDMYGAEALRGGAQPQSRSGRHANHPFHHGFDHASFETPPFPFFGTRSSFHFRNPEEIFREFFGDVHSHFDQMFTGMHPMHPPMPMFPGFPSPGFSSSSSSSTFHSSRGVHPIQSFLSSSSSSSLGPSSSFSTSHEVTTTYVNGQKRIHTKTRDAQGNVSEEIITVGPDGHQHVQRIGSSTSQPPQGLPFAHGHPSGGHRMNSSNSVSMSNTSTHPHSHSHWQHHR